MLGLRNSAFAIDGTLSPDTSRLTISSSLVVSPESPASSPSRGAVARWRERDTAPESLANRDIQFSTSAAVPDADSA